MVRGGSEDVPVEEIVKKFQSRSRSIVGFHGIPRQDVEDLVQQTLVTYLCRRHEVRDPEAWLVGTLNQRCRMFWRSRRRSWLSTVEDEVLEAAGAGESPPQDRLVVRRDLSHAISRLPERWRALVQLKFGMGLDSKETAKRLGYRPSGIYTITKRCLAALAREMETLGWEQPSTYRSTTGPITSLDRPGRNDR